MLINKAQFLSKFEQPLRAVLLDVDGTLYYQPLVRFFMALELSTLPIRRMSFKSAYNTWRAIGCFRRLREELRNYDNPERSLAKIQYIEAAKRRRVKPATMESLVSIWLHKQPLRYLKICRRPGVEEFFSFLDCKGVEVGVFSDYPVIDKLKALGLYNSVSIALCATDPEINALKPHPKGFLHAAAIWRIRPKEILYIGDRPEIDAVGAAAAGMPCVILSRKRIRPVQIHSEINYLMISSFHELKNLLADITHLHEYTL